MRRGRDPEASDMNTNKIKKTGFKDFILYFFLHKKTTESTEYTEKNSTTLCSLWLKWRRPFQPPACRQDAGRGNRCDDAS
jgi:hypothetical protein